MLRKMSIEIFVNRFYKDPIPFIKESYIPKESEVTLENACSKATFTAGIENRISTFETDPNKIVVLSSGGKESLLCYGLIKEAEMEVYPIFINESGGHWKTALTAYRAFKEDDSKTKRVWSNVDRLYTFLVRNLKVIKEDIKGVRSITDPIHFFSFAHYIFSTLPLIEKNGIGNICIGNEFDEPNSILEGKNKINDVEFFPGIYDQSQEFDSYMTKWFNYAGFNIKQWAPIRSITGFLVQKILAERYHNLFKLQTSCHHTHIKDNEVIPCGSCQKCTRILSFCISNGIDYTQINYSKDDIKKLHKNLEDLKLGPEELEHTYHKLSKNGFNVSGIKHDHVEKLHFDPVSSNFENIPKQFRTKIYPILLSNSKGAVKLSNKGNWEDFNLETILR